MQSIRILKKILPFFKKFYWPIGISLALVTFVTALDLSSQFIIGRVVDGFVSENQQVLLLWMIIFVIAFAVEVILQRFHLIYEMKTIEFELGHHVSNISLVKAFGLSLGQIKREHSGFKQSILNKGKNSMSNLMQMGVYDLLPLMVRIFLALIGLAFLHISLVPILLGYGIIYMGINIYLNKQMHAPIRKMIEQYTGIEKNFSDVLRNLFFVKFSNQSERTMTHIKSLQYEHIDHGTKAWIKYNWRQFFATDVVSIILLGAVTFLLYRSITAGEISVGSFVPIISWTFAFMYSLSRLRRIQRRFTLSLLDVERMFDMLEQKSDIEIDPNAKPAKVFEDKIAFERVSFRYDDGKQKALANINFEIKKGEKVALVGRSGSGKTTIISLLLRLYDPTHGDIMVDGVALRKLVLGDWHDLIAYVPQDGDLLDISIKENIAFGAKRAVTEAETESVLEKAGIKEFIHNLPNGVDTIVGERGVKLSGGQKQRVCIARALIKDAPILVLDEATSSLDSETESVVNKAIWDMLGDKTGVVIAHRLSTIIDADKIVVMDDGEVIAVGTHKELLKTCAYYKVLVDAQNVNL